MALSATLSEYEPMPQTPRGYYLAAGYADARQLPGVQPGEGTPESQDLDYAVLYFQEEAGRGGVSGFLASEARDENEFLSSSVEKMLAGYPVDGVPESKLGKLHATPIFTDALTPAFHGLKTTSAVYGVGGISGGPLFARRSNGTFILPRSISVVQAKPSSGRSTAMWWTFSCGPRLVVMVVKITPGRYYPYKRCGKHQRHRPRSAPGSD